MTDNSFYEGLDGANSVPLSEETLDGVRVLFGKDEPEGTEVPQAVKDLKELFKGGGRVKPPVLYVLANKSIGGYKRIHLYYNTLLDLYRVSTKLEMDAGIYGEGWERSNNPAPEDLEDADLLGLLAGYDDNAMTYFTDRGILLV